MGSWSLIGLFQVSLFSLSLSLQALSARHNTSQGQIALEYIMPLSAYNCGAGLKIITVCDAALDLDVHSMLR